MINASGTEEQSENQKLDIPRDAFEGETLVFAANGYDALMIHEAFAEMHGASILNELTPEADVLIIEEAVDDDLLDTAKEFGVDVWHYVRFEHYIVMMNNTVRREDETPADEEITTKKEEVEALPLDTPSDELDGLSFVFSGMDNEPLLILESFARLHGATVEDEVTAETDYLVRGEYVDEDLRKRAEIQEVPMILFIEFEAYVVHGVFSDEQEVGLQ